ncbi:protein kinase [Candidatus Zixiibacteriota bacterium]
MIGQTVAQYTIIEKLGAGGMGEVWLAQDSSLDRKVALKFLPQNLQNDPEASKRFIREAKSAAALDHPYICNIHQIGDAEGSTFIAMEYVGGMTLKDRLADSPLGMEEATSIAKEISEALSKAHQEGILHRDLKPSNIMLTPDGHVKVMDFGLAKQLAQGLEDTDSEVSLTASLTQEGVLVGSLGYMSPEQVRGEKLDFRSDIFSLGVVFFEMLTGQNPFIRDNPMDTLSAVLSETVQPLTTFIQVPPPELIKVVNGMLEKDPVARIQSIRELSDTLSHLQIHISSLPSMKSRMRVRLIRRTGLIAGAVLITALAFSVIVKQVSRIIGPSIIPVTLVGRQLRATDANEGFPAWRPVYGDMVAYTSNEGGSNNIWVLNPNLGLSTRNLTEELEGDQSYAAWSHDGEWIAFRSVIGSTTYLYTMSWMGEQKRIVHEFQGVHGEFCINWLDSDRLLFRGVTGEGEIQDSPLYSISIADNSITQLVGDAVDRPTGRAGEISPNGRFIAYSNGDANLDRQIYVLDQRTMAVEMLPIRGRGILHWHPDGERLLFLSGEMWDRQDLFSIRINSRTGRVRGKPTQLTHNSSLQSFNISPEGDRIIAAKSALLQAQLWALQIDNPPTKTRLIGESLTAGNALYLNAKWVPDTDDIVCASDYFGNLDIWRVYKDNNQPKEQLTNDPYPSLEVYPAVSPDGSLIAYWKVDHSGHVQPFLMNIDGASSHPIEIDGSLWSSEAEFKPTDWSYDGTMLAGHVVDGDQQFLATIKYVPSTRAFTQHRRLDVPGRSSFPYWSPDDKHLAYQSLDESGWTIWVVHIADGTAQQITGQGVSDPSLYNLRIHCWASEPSYIYIGRQLRELWRIPMNSEGLPAGSPEACGQAPEGYLFAQVTADVRGNLLLLPIIDSSRRNIDLWIYDLPGYN